MLLAECFAAGFNGERIGRASVYAGHERENRNLLGEAAADSIGVGGANSMQSRNPSIIVRYIPELPMN